MRSQFIQSPRLSRLGRRGGYNSLAGYAVNSVLPPYVLDFRLNRFFADGAAVEKSAAVNFSRPSLAWGIDATTGLLREYGVHEQRTNNKMWTGQDWVVATRHERDARSNLVTSSDDMSGWTASNITATKDQIGADGVANSANRLTANADGGTILLTVTAATADYAFGALVKRLAGTGTVEMTVDGGATWVDVTDEIPGEFVPVSAGAGLNTTNPQIGYRLGTSGDEIAVHVNQLEATSKYVSSPMPTVGFSWARASEYLYGSAGTVPWGDAVTVQMVGGMDYIDDDSTFSNLRWGPAGANELRTQVTTGSTQVGSPQALQRVSGTINGITAVTNHYTPDRFVRFSQASVFSTTRHQFAAEETLATEDATGAMPNLTANNVYFGFEIMGWFEKIAIFAADVGDTGLREASYQAPLLPARTNAYFVGDSTVVAYLGGAGLDTLVDSARNKVMLALPNQTIAQQKAAWQSAPKIEKRVGWVTVQVGLNDLDPAEDAATAIARLQDLIDTIRADSGSNSKIAVAQLTPSRGRLITIYGATDGPVAYQKWLDINEAIAGGGATPITAVDARVTSHVAAMNDGAGNLHPSYDTGDGIHPNTAGRTINAAAYEAAIAAIGITV